MAKPATSTPSPTQEMKVAKPPADQPPGTPNATFSFLELAEESAADVPTKLADAKQAILAMIPKQKGYLELWEAGKDLPKTRDGSGDRTVATWFTQHRGEPFWTNIRWGQRSLTIAGKKAWRFPNAEKLHAFYDAVEKAIRAGELDEVIRTETAKRPSKEQPQPAQDVMQ